MINTLRQLLLNYGLSDSSEAQANIEVEIWKQFGAERTVLIWDMSGFSLLTRRHGIVHYLSMVRRMQEAARPIVHQFQGAMVKFEADNGFAVFREPEYAIRAAIEMNRVFNLENTKYPDEFDIRVSCGLAHGKIILLEGQDFYGNAVNTASKLGEDLAKAGEILVSESALDELPEGVNFGGDKVELSISGIDLKALRIDCPLTA